jgi:hypothetical protein
MKKSFQIIFMLGACLFFSINADAQVDSAKALILKTKLETAICTCLTQKDSSAINTDNDIKAVIASCIFSNMGIFSDYVTAYTGSSPLQALDRMPEISEMIGNEVYSNCSAVQLFLNRVLRIIKKQ